MLLGVDAGGTSTRAVLVDEGGRCLGYGRAGGGNPVSWGAERATEQIVAAVTDARRQAGQRHDLPVEGAVVAMAGGSAFSGTGLLDGALRALGVRGPISVASDLLATFCAGTPERDGYALVAGTGAAAVRVRDGQVDASADGLGWLLGDVGSGFWIGHRVVTAALAALDGRGPSTTLTALLLAELGLADRMDRGAGGRRVTLQAAVDTLYQWRPVELSRFAALAFRVADTDPMAREILDRARESLVGTVRAVRSEEVTGPVVIGGGVARRLPGMAEALAVDLPWERPPEVALVTDGTVGAGVLALRQAGIAVDGEVFASIVGSVADRGATGGLAG